jgi:hypothetical protein
MMVDPSPAANLQDAIAALAERVHDVDVRAYESMPPERLVEGLHPVVSGLLTDAGGVIANVLAAFDDTTDALDTSPLASPYVPFEQAVDAAIHSHSVTSHRAVADIAFLAQLELRQRQERLARVATCGNAVAMVSECDSALRRIRKALASLDHALARAGLVRARLDFASEVDLSLRVRRACAKLRTRLLSAGDPTPEELHGRLRGAGTTIAMLVGWDVYPQLRVRDRLQLRELQRRVLEWLRSDHDRLSGMRLWQDLVGFVRMLGQVSRRQELVEHDSQVIRDARARLTDGAVPGDLLALLARLEGLDEDVDALLASSARTDSSSSPRPRSSTSWW